MHIGDGGYPDDKASYGPGPQHYKGPGLKIEFVSSL